MPLKAYFEAHNVEVVVGAHFGKCNSLKSRTVASYRDPRDWIDILRQHAACNAAVVVLLDASMTSGASATNSPAYRRRSLNLS